MGWFHFLSRHLFYDYWYNLALVSPSMNGNGGIYRHKIILINCCEVLGLMPGTLSAQ